MLSGPQFKPPADVEKNSSNKNGTSDSGDKTLINDKCSTLRSVLDMIDFTLSGRTGNIFIVNFLLNGGILGRIKITDSQESNGHSHEYWYG